VRADIHDGQEHKRSMQGPDTDAQDQPPPFAHIRLATHGRSKGNLADPSGISQLYPRNRTSRPFATDVGNGLRADVALFEILPSSFAIGKHLEPQ
jgi:hypothetical protein